MKIVLMEQFLGHCRKRTFLFFELLFKNETEPFRQLSCIVNQALDWKLRMDKLLTVHILL